MGNKKCQKISIPDPVGFQCPVMILRGNRELFIENYKGISDYTKTHILVDGKEMKVEVDGSNLMISYYTNMEMKIVGTIESVWIRS